MEISADKRAEAARVEAIKAVSGRPMTLQELLTGDSTPPAPSRIEAIRRDLDEARAAGLWWRASALEQQLAVETIRVARMNPLRWVREPDAAPSAVGVPFSDGPVKPERAGVQLVGVSPE